MKLRLLQNYNMMEAGEIIEPGKAVADLLISRGVAEEIKPKPKRGRRRNGDETISDAGGR